MRNLIAFLLLLATAPAFAQPRTQTCPDGRVVVLSPFNPNPCGGVTPPAEQIPDLFIRLFGPPPVSEDFRDEPNPSLAFRVARVEYESNLRGFQGEIPMPAAYLQKPKHQPTSTVTIAEYYASWGMGEPVFWRTIYAEYLSFPDAPYGPLRQSVQAALLAPAVTVAGYQAHVIEDGACVLDIQAFVPQPSRMKNRQNCGEDETPASSPPLEGAFLGVFGAESAITLNHAAAPALEGRR